MVRLGHRGIGPVCIGVASILARSVDDAFKELLLHEMLPFCIAIAFTVVVIDNYLRRRRRSDHLDVRVRGVPALLGGPFI